MEAGEFTKSDTSGRTANSPRHRALPGTGQIHAASIPPRENVGNRPTAWQRSLLRLGTTEASIAMSNRRQTAISHPQSYRARHPLTGWLVTLAISLFGLWVVAGMHLVRGLASDMRGRIGTRPTVHAELVERSLPSGPWGRVEHESIFLPNPSAIELLPEPVSSTPAVWHFPGTDRAQLSDLFAQIGLADSLSRTLLTMAKPSASYQGMTIAPTREIVLGLNPEIRSKLYTLLAMFAQNEDQARSPRCVCDSPEQWFAGAGLTPEIRRIVDRVAGLTDDEARRLLGEVLADFSSRHRDIESILLGHFYDVRARLTEFAPTLPEGVELRIASAPHASGR